MKQRQMTKNDSKKLLTTVHTILGKRANSAPSLNDSDGSFIKAQYFHDFFSLARLAKLRHDIPAANADTTLQSISDQIMKETL
jgi:hypothetical protein